MRAAVGGVIVAVTATAVAYSIAASFVRTKALKEVTRIIGSLLLVMCILNPIVKSGGINFKLPGTKIKEEMKNIAQSGLKKQRKITNSAVASKITSYIEEKVKNTYGISVSVSLETVADEDGVFSIRSASVIYNEAPTESAVKSVARLIEAECGVPPARQKHKSR